jgi:GT2 family glycosyltransferase
MNNQVDVVILTPGHSMTAPYVKSLLATGEMFRQKGITWAWSSEYSSHVGDAREITLSGTRTNNPFNNLPFEGNLKYKKLMWIDSDISWEPEDVLKLYESDKDIVSGVYLFENGTTSSFKKFLGDFYNYSEVLEMKEPIEIEGCGFGFLCITSGIFESMSRPWFQSINTTVRFDEKEMTFPIMGEDVSWCARAIELGYKIWMDPSVLVNHHKTIKLTWEGLK